MENVIYEMMLYILMGVLITLGCIAIYYLVHSLIEKKRKRRIEEERILEEYVQYRIRRYLKKGY